MSNKEIIEKLKNAEVNGESAELDKYGSWAVYGKNAMDAASNHGTIHVKDMGFPDNLSIDELAKKINPKYMLVALNVSKNVADKNISWHNFHYVGDKTKDKNSGVDKSKDGNSKDGNILKIIKGSDFFGAYMTDIIKGFPESKSDVVLRKIAGSNRDKYKDIVKSSINKFNAELDTIKPEKIIIFGDAAFEVFKMAVKKDLLHVSNNIEVIKTPHYSKQNYKNACMYKRFTKNDPIKDIDEYSKHKVSKVRGKSLKYETYELPVSKEDIEDKQ